MASKIVGQRWEALGARPPGAAVTMHAPVHGCDGRGHSLLRREASARCRGRRAHRGRRGRHAPWRAAWW